MTREAVVRRLLLPMTRYAEAHVEIDVAPRDGLVRDVAVARRAVDVRADVRRVIEPDVRRLRVAVDALPVEVEALVLERRDRLDPRLVGRDRRVADHAGVHARQPGDRSLRDALMTVLGAADTLL